MFSSALTPLQSKYCRLCNTTTPTRSAWLTHLSSSSHQMLMKAGGSRRKSIIGAGTDKWDRSRSIKISDCQGLSLASILQYLDSWGPVENFCHLLTKTEDGEILSCYALMKSRTNANTLVFYQEPHRVPPTGQAITILKWTAIPSKDHHKRKRSESGGGGSGSPFNEDSGEEPELQPVPAPPEPEGYSGPQPQVPHVTGEFLCSSCSVQESILADWVIHLCSDGHRKVKNNPDFGLKSWDSKKAVCLQRAKGLSKMQILEWALPWGHVSDYIYSGKDTETEPVDILFDVEETSNKILNFKDYHIISGQRVDVNPIPEFAGYSKAEKQILKAEKLASEMISIAATSMASTSTIPDDLDNSKESEIENERRILFNLLKGKPLEEQFSIFLNYASWPESFYQNVDRFLKDVLVFMVRRLEPPFNNACQLLSHGQYACRTGLRKKQKATTINLLLNVRSSATNPVDLNQFPVQVDLIHKLRLGIESSVNSVPGSLRALPIDMSNYRPCLCFSTAADPPMDFMLNIELDNPLAAQEAELISYYCDLDPRVRPLLLIILQWNELNGSLKSPDELFPNHLLSSLVLFYLVHMKILPSVHQICEEDKGNRQPILVQGYDISFPKPMSHRKSQPELKDPSILALSVTGLLKGFCQFYGYVDIQNNVFCLRLGTMISKAHFFSGSQSNLPAELRGMIAQGGGQLYSVSSLVVQDVFVLTMNLCKSRGKKSVYKFVGFCRKAFHQLEAGFTLEQPSLDVIFQEKSETHPKPVPVLYLPKF